MKKVVLLGVLLGLLFAFPACNKEDNSGDTTSSTTQTTTKKEYQPADLSSYSMHVGSINESDRNKFYTFSVTNDYPVPMECVICTISFVAGGKVLDTVEDQMPVPSVLNPGETAYLTGTYMVPEEYAGLELSVEVELKALPVEQERVSFVFKNLKQKETQDGVLVTGTVWNNTGTDTSDCVAYVLAFDYLGFMAMEPIMIKTLKHGEKQQFEVLLAGRQVKDITKVEGIGYDKASLPSYE